MNVNIDCPHCKMNVSVELHSAFPLDEGYNDFLEKCPECETEVHIELVAQVSAEQCVHTDPSLALVCECGSLYGVHEKFCPKYNMKNFVLNTKGVSREKLLFLACPLQND